MKQATSGHMLTRRLALLGMAACAGATCEDGGPWECAEDGCPAPTLDCSVLAGLGACASTFAEVWSRPPSATFEKEIAELCPRACGRCAPSECNIEQIDASALDPSAIASSLLGATAPRLLKFSSVSLQDDLLRSHGNQDVKVVLEGGVYRGDQKRESIMTLNEYIWKVSNRSLERSAYVFWDASDTAIAQSSQSISDLYSRMMIARDVGFATIPKSARGRTLLSAGSWHNGRPFHSHGPTLFSLASGIKHWYIKKPHSATSIAWINFEATPWAARNGLPEDWSEYLWQCTQRAGDVLWVPDMLPHATMNFAETTLGVAVLIDDLQTTPLHFAASTGDETAVKELLRRNSEPEVLGARARNGATPLHYAAGLGHAKIAEMLLDAGARADARSKNGGTALHAAAVGGHLRVVRLLGLRGASVAAKDEDGMTPFMLATARGHQIIARLLSTFEQAIEDAQGGEDEQDAHGMHDEL